MAGEISPDMMFCGYRQKWSRMGEDGYISGQMGEDECMSNEEIKNKTKCHTKRGTNGRTRHGFVLHDHSEKRHEVGRYGLGDQRGSWGGIEGNQGARSV